MRLWYSHHAVFEQKERQKRDILVASNRKLDLIKHRVSRAPLMAAHSACLAVSSENLLEEELGVSEQTCGCYAKLNFQHPASTQPLLLVADLFGLDGIHSRWRLKEDQLTILISTSATSVNIETECTWSGLLAKFELQFRNCGNDFDSIKFIWKAISESERKITHSNVIPRDDSVILPGSDDVRKIGRPPKEVCHRIWKRAKNPNKTHAEQMQAKVTTWKVVVFIQWQSNIY